ncbi:MAG TPA: VIT domain-containing protein [Pirellulales bacterium]|nr:VIT domain-containing protein [Pirellulales bacterium]
MIRAVRPFETNEAVVSDEEAGFGALRSERGCLPLRSLDVRAKICGLHAQATVRQTFHNAFSEAIEATYIFPLPDRAAVTAFTLRVAGRVVEGVLRERQQARQEYDQAIAAGHRASIAEEERSGTFSLRVGNLPPGEDVSVELTLVGPLTVAHGEAEFRFPLVVAPRYVPGVPLAGPSVGSGVAPDSDQAPDASRVTPPVLLPGFPNPVRLSLEVAFDRAAFPTTPDCLTRSLRSSLHSLIVDEVAGLTVRLQPSERLNRDFILRFALAGQTAESILSYSPADASRPGTFAVSIVPPSQLDRPAKPRDLVFVLDRSGSMSGWKMVAARRAVGRLLDTLLEHDRFSVLAFDNAVEFSPETPRQLVAAGNRARWRTIEWLSKVDARGGTEMAAALVQATELLAGGDDAREGIIVLITDGQVAGEDSLLKTLASKKGRRPRIFAVGIDRAVNAGFLRCLADMGRGACELVESEDRLDEVMEHLHRLTSSPALRELRLEPIGWQWHADSLAPSRLPDVFVDRPVTIFGRHASASEELRLRLTAIDALGKVWQQEVIGRASGGALLTGLWGRARVRELEDRYASQLRGNNESLAQQIVAVSLESHVLSRFTAYVAVDRSEVVNADGKPREILQPVELPEGWQVEALESCVMGGGSGSLGLTSLAALPPMGLSPDAPRARGKNFGFFAKRMHAPAPIKNVPSFQPANQAEAVAEVADALAALKSRSRFATRRRRIQELIDRLESVASLMDREHHVRRSEVNDLVVRGRELLAAASLQGKSLAAAVDEFIAKVQSLVDELRQSPTAVRNEFWK